MCSSSSWWSVAQVRRDGYSSSHGTAGRGATLDTQCLMAPPYPWHWCTCPRYWWWRWRWCCHGRPQRTLPFSSPPYGGLSSAPCRAPSLSPPRRSCRICCEVFWTSAVETGATAGVRELRSKLAGLSGSRASMLMVRQLMLAMVEAAHDRGVAVASAGSRINGCVGG